MRKAATTNRRSEGKNRGRKHLLFDCRQPCNATLLLSDTSLMLFHSSFPLSSIWRLFSFFLCSSLGFVFGFGAYFSCCRSFVFLVSFLFFLVLTTSRLKLTSCRIDFVVVAVMSLIVVYASMFLIILALIVPNIKYFVHHPNADFAGNS